MTLDDVGARLAHIEARIAKLEGRLLRYGAAAFVAAELVRTFLEQTS